MPVPFSLLHISVNRNKKLLHLSALYLLLVACHFRTSGDNTGFPGVIMCQKTGWIE